MQLICKFSLEWRKREIYYLHIYLSIKIKLNFISTTLSGVNLFILTKESLETIPNLQLVALGWYNNESQCDFILVSKKRDSEKWWIIPEWG